MKSGTKLFAGLQTGAVRKIPGRAAFAACELRGLQAKARALVAGNVDLVTRKQQGCPAAGLTNEMVVPRPSPCTAGLGIGAKRTVRLFSADNGVQITAVVAEHGNTLDPAFLTDPEKSNLAANNLSPYVALSNGFVLTFTNGLRIYLTGDTGLTSDMRIVVRGFYGAQLVVFNIGDIFTTGPEEAAFAVTKLI